MNKQAQKWGLIEGWVSSIVNLALFGVKLWVGLVAGSIAMQADAWHTLSDTLTSVVVIAGFWMAARKPDHTHPFGHGRAEAVAAVVAGTLLGIVGFAFARESIAHLRAHSPVTFSSTAIIVFLVSVFVKEGMAQFSIRLGRKFQSQALLADGWHHRSDAVASGLVVIGAMAGGRWWWIDGVLGILVSGLILYATYDIFKGSMSTLLGEKPAPDLEVEIEALAARIAPGRAGVHHLHAHRYGDHVEVTFHLTLPDTMNLEEAHDIATAIENAIRDELGMEPTLHLEPQSVQRTATYTHVKKE